MYLFAILIGTWKITFKQRLTKPPLSLLRVVARPGFPRGATVPRRIEPTKAKTTTNPVMSTKTEKRPAATGGNAGLPVRIYGPVVTISV
jgi:hypothetical protein